MELLRLYVNKTQTSNTNFILNMILEFDNWNFINELQRRITT